MRKGLWTLALLCVPLAGCQMPCSTTGWRFEVLKPATINGSSIVSQQPGLLGISGVGSGAVLSEVGTVTSPGNGAGIRQGIVPQSALPANGWCELQDVCRRLDALEKRFGRQSIVPEHVPMPKGSE